MSAETSPEVVEAWMRRVIEEFVANCRRLVEAAAREARLERRVNPPEKDYVDALKPPDSVPIPQVGLGFGFRVWVSGFGV